MSQSVPAKKKPINRVVIAIIAGSLLVLCVICVIVTQVFQSGANETETPIAQAQTTEQFIVTQVPTQPPTNTAIPEPTETSAPTATPEPTDTPEPTQTPTQPPEPIVLTGSGDQVLDVEKWSGPALARINYSGGSNFIVENFGSDGEQIELLVNTIGNYSGMRPLDFLADEHTTRFQIQSSGEWTIEILPLTEIRRVSIPGTFEGNGDDVVFLDGNNPDLLIVDASQADSNFIVVGYGDTRDLLVNEIAPYEGTSIFDSGIIILEIRATGPWSMEITSQ